MLTVYAPGANTKFPTNLDCNRLHEASPSKINNVNSSSCFSFNTVLYKAPSNYTIYGSSFSGKGLRQLNIYHVSHTTVSKKWLEFISAGVNAYALGCTDEGLRKELTDMKETGVEIEAMQNYGGNTSLKSKIASEEINECILWLSIIFITILCTPQPTIVRWSSTPPISDEVRLQWKGFCALIANAYYLRGMAWLPVKTLQLEQMAVVGRAEEPSVVASRMQLVFSTLEVVSPQWPRV